jgi:hypothetical protein
MYKASSDSRLRVAAGRRARPEKPKEDVVDAEFVDVDDKK